ncbi:MAG: vanadium-dependent haloperoxidase [Acidobacteria bacterium]|nr:vanadium-dependent haloperoxidase [Acidobacteriota bacterium]
MRHHSNRLTGELPAERRGPRGLRLVGLLLALAALGSWPTAWAAAPRGALTARNSSNRFQSPDEAGPKVAVSWFDLLYKLIQTERLSPPVASRAIGYTGVALYEAVAPGSPGRISLAGQLNALPPLPEPDLHRKYDWQLVAHAALNGTIRGLFPQASADSKAAIDALDRQLLAELRRNVPPPVVDRSLDLGGDLATSILAWASGDQFTQFNNCAFTPPTGDGIWIPTPPLFRPALQPCWGELRPFVLHTGAECGAPPPPVYSTDSGSDFYAEGLEVYDTTKNPTAEQTAIALFWADNAGETGTPPGHWISIVGQIARQRHLSLGTASEAYARVGLAVADSFISCWNTKFVFNLLRPVTYIQQNIDADWTSPIATPPFAEYTSGHSVQSGAAATVLTDLLGEFPFTDDTHAARGLPARWFDSFEEAAEEAAVSRLYGGIHYRSAIERGITQGQCIAGRIEDRVHFKKSSPNRR